ncbi:MAG: hypothetical protein ABI425_02760 [Patescibacteria group bacterium]
MPDVYVAPKKPVAKTEVQPESEAETPRRSRRGELRDITEFSQVLRDTPRCTNPYVAFSPRPLQVSFESQAEEERIVLFVRRHFATQIWWILVAIILALLPIILSFVPLLDFFPERFHLVFLAGWYTFIFGFALESFLLWFFNVNILTDERVVDIDFYSMLYKKLSTAQIDRIEDVTSTTGGFLGSLLDYGTVDIQTAANSRELSFEQVPNPEKIVQILNELIMEEEREQLEGRIR